MATRQAPASIPARILRKLYPAGAAVLLLAALGSLAAPAAVASASAAQVCRNPIEPSATIPEVPWAQQWFAPERVWPLATGSGVTVAVLDSGVDHTHPQLAGGRVLPGRDLVSGGGRDGRDDCDAHGTAVASIVAAAEVEGIGFAGLAPEAEILPVRVADRSVEVTDPGGEPPVTPEDLAEAITWAADQGAQVINASIVFYHDHDVIAEAVRHAQDRDAVVVAAVGNVHLADAPDPVPYPAAYPGVVGVGAIGVDGGRPDQSYTGRYVDLVAPGDQVTAAAPVSGHVTTSGTSFAAPFVSAIAALVRSAAPQLPAAEVVHRLTATADPAGAPDEYGHGVANPYRALTERLADGEPAAAEPLAEVAVDPAAVAQAEQRERTVRRAVLVAAVAVSASVVAAAGIALWRRGRRRHWRPDAPAVPSGAPDERGSGPGTDEPERVFFTVPAPPR